MSDSKRMTGQFNSCIEDKLLIIANEFTSEMKSYFINMNILKSQITEETQIVEGKYQNAREITDYSAFIFLTNNYNLIKIDEKSRRFAMFTASSKYKGNTEFFANFAKKFHNKKAADVVYTALLKRDLSNFDITKIPRTETLLEAIEVNKDPCELLLEYKFDEIEKKCDAKNNISLNDLYEIYRNLCYEMGIQTNKILGKNKFSSRVKSLGIFDYKRTKYCILFTLKKNS